MLFFKDFTNNYYLKSILKHTWTTLALEIETDISVVANMLDHTNISTTYNYYLKPRESTYQ